MKISVQSKVVAVVPAQVHGYFFPTDKATKRSDWAVELTALDDTLSGYLSSVSKANRLSPKKVLFFPTLGSDSAAEHIALIGLPETVDPESMRWMGANLRKECEAVKMKSVAVSFGTLPPDMDFPVMASAFLEGFLMAGYRFDVLKAAPKKNEPRGPFVQSLIVSGIAASELRAVRSAVNAVSEIIDAQAFSRDMQNLPPNHLTPDLFAKKVRGAAKDIPELSVTVFDERALKKMKANAFLAVGRGSANPPRMVVMEYRPSGNRRGGKSKKSGAAPVVFVGKGLCFDSGGISIKPGAKMDEMKFDMSGAAAAAGAVLAAARIKLPVPVTAILGLAVNVPSATSYLPSDVVTAMDGTTIEVINTDAEGRMVLADCLAYVKKKYPKSATIDLATLTGACVVALGNRVAGLFSTDAKLIDALKRAGESSGERLWEMPMFDEYDEDLESAIADVKHLGGSGGGAITAARFLKRFAPEHWAHLDIAGTSWLGGFTGSSKKPYLQSGLGTGFGVRLLVEFLRSRI